ncbi:nicotinamide riboside kinase 1 isoform X1 [Neodiprion virginianus]|uniref:nicotinamide riboside kinase 1 isoform X1 n=1 Tax=Neodiprion fabricii TaxID=2872261 RepID=UPI001ED9489C|nr:nicotinamide riboside kinase 1 isoform X1 [Neodiprion fabricii]XP_046610351.1 nicotinamide riboside kinase 1 isoform X1 [Neodiprion virginianus]
MSDWLIVGISGVTCSGKTTLSKEINAKLTNSVVISQDDYFLPTDSPRHTFIPELNHINMDIISSLDMEKMHNDILQVIQDFETGNGDGNCRTTRRVLIVEGFLIFSYKPISDLTNLKYFITLDKDECWKRRELRTYLPPDVPGYYEKIVWPEYLKHKSEIINDSSLSEVKFIDGSRSKKDIFDEVYSAIKCLMCKECSECTQSL